MCVWCVYVGPCICVCMSMCAFIHLFYLFTTPTFAEAQTMSSSRPRDHHDDDDDNLFTTSIISVTYHLHSTHMKKEILPNMAGVCPDFLAELISSITGLSKCVCRSARNSTDLRRSWSTSRTMMSSILILWLVAGSGASYSVELGFTVCVVLECSWVLW